jgi:hypothetical protein
MSNSMSDPLNVWEQLWETLADGILYQRQRTLNSLGSRVLAKCFHCLFVYDGKMIRLFMCF